MLTDYKAFIENKRKKVLPSGINAKNINVRLYEFQHDIVKWALKMGRAAIFADCGLGKTPMQLEWANQIKKNVLILAPLAVSLQTIREGEKFGITVKYCRHQSDVAPGITIANYEMFHEFDMDYFSGIVLDESSILKSYTGKFRNEIIDRCRNVPFKLACTATPSPNDYMELGNHSEFLGIMSRTEMLSMFFVHDGGETQQWRLKGHAQEEFWKWICGWAVMMKKPSDLGYDDKDFILPKLNVQHIQTSVDISQSRGDMLFRMPAEDLCGRRIERKLTIDDRTRAVADMVNNSSDTWLIWCNLNDESSLAKKLIPDSREIKGSDSREYKEKTMLDFSQGKIRVLITKPKIAGFGMNWQHCHKVAFLGLSDSYEQFYQAIRRCYRFGQKKQVDCFIVTAETEGVVVENIKRKELDANNMAKEMVKHMQVYNSENIRDEKHQDEKYSARQNKNELWDIRHGDSCVELTTLKSGSIHYSIFSPPFADLYVYSDSDRDLGNCRSRSEFFEHFMFIIKELYRVIMPGRLVSFHCMNLPTSKTRDGFIGLSDFRGELIKYFQDAGFIFHSEVCIWKDPVVAVTRTKALGLLHKQLVKDSAMSRQGIPDYLVTMRKPGENKEPVSGELDRWVGDSSAFERRGKMSIDIWQKYASPVWMDINQTRTLQASAGRDEKDERHICPLQLDVIERGIQLWTNEGDTVLSPFMGIGSEGYVAIKTGRKFIGIELKKSYFDQSVKNMQRASSEIKSESLFSQTA